MSVSIPQASCQRRLAWSGNYAIVTLSNAIGETLCNVWGYVMGVCLLTTLYTMAAVAGSRHHLVVLPRHISRLFTVKVNIAISVIVWLAGMAVMSPTLPFMGDWSSIEFNAYTGACSFARNGGTYEVFVLCAGFAIPLFIIILFYARLFYFVWKNRRRQVAPQKSTAAAAKEIIVGAVTRVASPVGVVEQHEADNVVDVGRANGTTEITIDRESERDSESESSSRSSNERLQQRESERSPNFTAQAVSSKESSNEDSEFSLRDSKSSQFKLNSNEQRHILSSCNLNSTGHDATSGEHKLKNAKADILFNGDINFSTTNSNLRNMNDDQVKELNKDVDHEDSFSDHQCEEPMGHGNSIGLEFQLKNNGDGASHAILPALASSLTDEEANLQTNESTTVARDCDKIDLNLNSSTSTRGNAVSCDRSVSQNYNENKLFTELNSRRGLNFTIHSTSLTTSEKPSNAYRSSKGNNGVSSDSTTQQNGYLNRDLSQKQTPPTVTIDVSHLVVTEAEEGLNNSPNSHSPVRMLSLRIPSPSPFPPRTSSLPNTISYGGLKAKVAQLGSHISSREMAVTKMMIAICFGFTFCFGLYFLVNIIDKDLSKLPRWLHKLSAWLLYMHSMINPIIYGVMNTQFRKDYKRIFISKRAQATKCYLRYCSHGSATGPVEPTSTVM